jgi:alpha-amylase/alpha-mannosidase (GH57 family)
VKYICIHGHFYQPPRENPWLESIEPQDSAAPYHDWNERINAQCYAPNTASRILDEQDRIVDIVNNYSRISFDFGPTLLSWLEDEAPEVYAAVLAADEESRERFGGHGSAMAQVYNHVIMPLARREDKEIQVAWGIRDFEHRFRRRPEGMWLAETAVDVETLEVLAEHEIRFTVLSPYQAASVKSPDETEWRDVSGGAIDSTIPYVQRLPSGREIALFFYDGPVSKAVAFEGLLHRGENFARRLAGILREDGRPRLAHIATDGESYGHHHPHGDMALAYALRAIEAQGLAKLTNYGEFLDVRAPDHEVRIIENTSWSCAHGIERWRSDCGCRTGGPAGWTQAWRAPLREALDWLRQRVAVEQEAGLAELFSDPRDAELGYVELILDRSPERVSQFLSEKARRELDAEEQTTVLKLLELGRQLQLMYTSCGWFFNDLSGIETTQVLRYAGRAVQLSQDLFGDSIEQEVLELLSRAGSNRPETGTGRDLYEKNVRPNRVTFDSLAAHYCINALFESYPERTKLYCYDVERLAYLSRFAGKTRLVVGTCRLTSTITRAGATLDFAVLNLGDHRVAAGVRRHTSEEYYHELARSLEEPFGKGDTTAVLRLLDQKLGPEMYDLKSLFGDEQRRVMASLLHSTLEEAEAAYRQIYEHHGATMRFLADLGVPSPHALSVAAEVVLNGNLRRALADEAGDGETVGDLIREAINEGVALDDATLSFTARSSLERIAASFFEAPESLEELRRLRRRIALVLALPFEVDLWRLQNLYFFGAKRLLAARTTDADADAEARDWSFEVLALGNDLSIHLPGGEEPDP